MSISGRALNAQKQSKNKHKTFPYMQKAFFTITQCWNAEQRTSWSEIREEFDLNATVFHVECLVYKIFATETNIFLLHSQEPSIPGPDSWAHHLETARIWRQQKEEKKFLTLKDIFENFHLNREISL